MISLGYLYKQKDLPGGTGVDGGSVEWIVKVV